MSLSWPVFGTFSLACSIGTAPAESERAVVPVAASEAGIDDAGRDRPRAEPESAPAPEPEPEPEPEPARPNWGHADTDPANDYTVGPPAPLRDCEERLEAAGVRFKAARIGVGKLRDGVYTCGAEQVVRYQQGPGGIKYHKSPLLTCGMALAMADLERIVQEQAERILGTRVKQIDHLGTYNCREMANYDWISEHSFANGIDLRRFHLQNGETITVLEHFRPQERDADAPETVFLRTLATRLFEEDAFSNVITPYFDALHRNHIHVDLARYRTDGSSP
jgi:hypothetical protein